MKLQFRCVRIQRFDGEKPKLGPDGKPIEKAIIEDGVAKRVFEMEPASSYVVELAQVGGTVKIDFGRTMTPMGFVEGNTYAVDIAV